MPVEAHSGCKSTSEMKVLEQILEECQLKRILDATMGYSCSHSLVTNICDVYDVTNNLPCSQAGYIDGEWDTDIPPADSINAACFCHCVQLCH